MTSSKKSSCTATPFQRPYDGQNFPAYFYDQNILCVAKAEYGGKTEYLYFPCEEEAIDKAFIRLGTTADEVKITPEDFNTDIPEWFGRFVRSLPRKAYMS